MVLKNFLNNLNILDLLFLQMSFTIVLFSILINYFNKNLPNCIKQMFFYGKHALKEKKSNPFIKNFEINKSRFGDFYVFAILWSFLSLHYGYIVYINHDPLPDYVIKFLDIFGGNDRQPVIDPLTTTIVLVIMNLQCLRRFYETNFIQIFSKQSNKINITHYLVGYIHYFGVIISILIKSEGFCNINESTNEINIVFKFKHIILLPFVLLFIYSWIKQYQTNLIFIQLRQNNVNNRDKHLIPTGDYFEMITSPHMFFEILIYIALNLIMYQNITFLFILFWVAANQIENALLTHKWYKETFKNYPKNRKAIIPFLL